MFVKEAFINELIRNMRKYIFLFMLLLVSNVFSQKGFSRGEDRRPDLNLRKAILIESNVVPSDSNYTCYFSYKIPFNNILFLKDGESFTGGISLRLEVHEDDVYIKSEAVNKKIIVKDYNLTNSENDFLEGLLKLNLAEGEYLIKPSLKIENLNRDILLSPFPLEIKSSDLNFVYPPIPVYNEKYSHENSNYFRLVNSEGFLPHSIQNYNLIIPVADSSINEIRVIIKQDDEEILNENYKKVEDIGFEISQINNAVCITNNSANVNTNLFLISGFSTKLNEGPAKLIVSINDEEKDFDINIAWLDKPKTLLNTEFAIKILENVTPSSEVSDLTDGDEEDYYKNLVAYWKKFDQNKTTAFNEVMNEFYRRADHAVKEYSTPNNRNGVSTDRGKIYIKYGKPDNVERSYSEKDNILEIWIYENINKRFVFADHNGLGNFTLLK